VTLNVDGHRPCVVLLEPNVGLRRAIHELLTTEDFEVLDCTSLEQVMQYAAVGEPRRVALVAWQSMEGMLADEHRHHLVQLTQRLPLVLMVPRRWKRLLEGSDLDFVGMVAKPFGADELLDTVRAALPRPVAYASG
jgi:DNA-binding response OmpR family regulator